RLLERLALIQHSISNREPLDDTLQAIVASARDLLGDASASVFLRAADEPRLLRAPDGETCVLGSGAAGRAAAEGRLVVVEDGEGRATATMAAPVHEQGDIVGALVVRSVEPGRTYTRGEQDMLHTLAEHASLALTDAST